MSRTIVLLCASVAACGGTEGAPKGTPSSVGAAIDPCATSQALTQHALADFESGPPPGLAVTSDNSKGSMIDPDSSHTDPYPSGIDVRCGVSRSLRALRTLGTSIAQLVTNTEPRDHLITVARYTRSREPSNVVGVHLYSFGGAVRTAAWMRELL